MPSQPTAETISQDDVNALWSKWRALARGAVTPEQKRLANTAWQKFCEIDDIVNGPLARRPARSAA